MTEGKILKNIIIFAIPCIISNILQNLYNLADTAIVGQLIGINSLAAVGSTGAVVALFINTITGLMSGFSIVASIRLGAKNYSELKRVFANALFIVIAMGALITIFGTMYTGKILKLMNTAPELMEEATIYLTGIFAGIITTMFYNFFCEMMRAVGNSKAPLVFLAISSALHIVLDYLFMGAFKTGVTGAAVSTVVSQGISAILCFIYIYKNVEYYRVERKDFKFDFNIICECLKVGLPMATVNFVVNFGTMVLQFVTNGIGTQYVAAYSSASKLGYIYTSPINGFTTALAVFVSQNFGAGNIQRIKKGFKQTVILLCGINTAVFMFSILCSPAILRFMVGNEQSVISSGNLYLTIRVLAGYMLIVIASCKSVLPAMGRTFYVTVSGFVEVAIRFISPVLLVQNLGFIGVPLSDAFTWTVLALFFAVVYPVEMRKVNKLTVVTK